jgi:hypothetical protein
MRHWLLQVLIAFDQLVNALLNGWADESLSSRAWRMWLKDKPFGKLFRPVIDALFIWQSGKMDHCHRAYDHELQRYNFPPEMR